MTKNQRIVVLALLTLVVSALVAFKPTSPGTQRNLTSILWASLFLMSFTSLLLEHYFGRPTDVIAAGVSILLLLVPSRDTLVGWGSWYWLVFGYSLTATLLATMALLLLTNTEGPSSHRNRASSFLKNLTTKAASGRQQYFMLFAFTLLFYVDPRSTSFIAFASYSALVLAINPQRALWESARASKNTSTTQVGEIFGVQGRNTFLVRLFPTNARLPLRVSDLLEFSYGMDEPPQIRRGMILERFFLDQAQWIRVLCHEEIDRQCKDIEPQPTHRRDAVYKVSGRDASDFLGSLVGVVREGTEVGSIRFLQAGRAPVYEGDLIQADTVDGVVLYQVVNARVDVENLESKNEADLVVGEAVQLGIWDPTKGLFQRYGWVPTARTPVMRARSVEPPAAREDEIEIGRIPGTEFRVFLNRSDAISHHTAILGVTGVGKSVFARNFVAQLGGDDTRIIVVDFTKEWAAKVPSNETTSMIDDDAAKRLFKAVDEIIFEESKFKNTRNTKLITDRKKEIFEEFSKAIEGLLKGDRPIGLFELPDVSNTEGVLEYTQWFFKTLFHISREHQNFGRRICVVLEEAHTVVPEWNFVGLADKSSQALVNNIGQIALQGRKYGIGFVVIAQRTASVSKTILTQCNTIIAFQCFDGTSLEFLSHYLPPAVITAVPNLRFRHAVAVGKALRGSVPLIIEVPEITEAIAPEPMVPAESPQPAQQSGGASPP